MNEATPDPLPKAPFGHENRVRLIERYFQLSEPLTFDNAWKHVYRLLIWIDRTTGLAHCYESDKAQPGVHWYERTLRFHDWLATQLDATPHGLADHIDLLFRTASRQLAERVQKSLERRRRAAERQRKPYEGRGFPEPGLDPELQALILEELDGWLKGSPPDKVLARLGIRILEHVHSENNRRNILGEGFEDVLTAIIGQTISSAGITTLTRPRLQDVPGFNEPREKDKVKRPDVVLITPAGWRSLVTVKWSIRADREEQFASDYSAYDRANKASKGFDYVVITNEFDAARIANACDRQSGAQSLFTAVVHVNPEAVLNVYGSEPEHSQKTVAERVNSGRLIGLETWLRGLLMEQR